MKKARTILHIVIILLLVFQLLAYLGSFTQVATATEIERSVPYYIGFNIPLIVAVILFLVSQYLKRKMIKKEDDTLIDSIGKN